MKLLLDKYLKDIMKMTLQVKIISDRREVSFLYYGNNKEYYGKMMRVSEYGNGAIFLTSPIECGHHFSFSPQDPTYKEVVDWYCNVYNKELQQ